jgi:hypothetical protein
MHLAGLPHDKIDIVLTGRPRFSNALSHTKGVSSIHYKNDCVRIGQTQQGLVILFGGGYGYGCPVGGWSLFVR